MRCHYAVRRCPAIGASSIVPNLTRAPEARVFLPCGAAGMGCPYGAGGVVGLWPDRYRRPMRARYPRQKYRVTRVHDR